MTEVLGHTKKTESVDLFSDFNFAFLSNIKKHEREDEVFFFFFRQKDGTTYSIVLLSADRQGRKSRGEIKDLATGFFFPFIM